MISRIGWWEVLVIVNLELEGSVLRLILPLDTIRLMKNTMARTVSTGNLFFYRCVLGVSVTAKLLSTLVPY